ncbi:MAG: hypothetical protein FWE89_01095 [Syntrophaceae bacterium]|nr:hypothetical protein [Syntrophaceae bacterium]
MKKDLLRYLVIGMAIIFGLFFLLATATAIDLGADNPLLEGTDVPKQFLVEISGTVMNETFARSQALLTLMGPVQFSRNLNPYQIIIEPFPQRNSRNSFYWISEETEMTAIANEITCDIKRTFIKPVTLFFVFLSPELLRHYGAAYEEEDYALQVALPTIILARAGKLKLRIMSDTVSGTVWMMGYDPVEKSFVQYNARLYGRKTDNLRPNQKWHLVEAGSERAQ